MNSGKLGNLLAKIKQEFLPLRKTLSQLIFLENKPFQAKNLKCGNISIGKCSGNHFNIKNDETTKKYLTVTNTKHKHIFETIVDFVKVMVTSRIPFNIAHQTVSVLVNMINNAHVEQTSKNVRTFSAKYNIVQKSNNLVTNSVRRYHNCASNIANYATCSKYPRPPGRHCYHDDTEFAINGQILAELVACYSYLSIACYFGETRISLPGCNRFFMMMHEEEQEHATAFIKYQNLRGGRVHLCALPAPCHSISGVEGALNMAIEMEKAVKEKLVALQKTAAKHDDFGVMDFVDDFLQEQDRSICELSRLLVRYTKMGDSGAAEFLFDKEMFEAFSSKNTKNRNEKTVDQNAYV